MSVAVFTSCHSTISLANLSCTMAHAILTGWYSNEGKGKKGWEDQLQAQFEKVRITGLGL
jgi:hypothetical protein